MKFFNDVVSFSASVILAVTASLKLLNDVQLHSPLSLPTASTIGIELILALALLLGQFGARIAVTIFFLIAFGYSILKT